MGVCCVDGCESDDEDVTYFPFPIKPALRRQWRDAIKPSVKLHIDSKVCSRHFPETDYERVRGKLRLKRGRVPSILHPGEKNHEKPPEVNGTDAASHSPTSPQSPDPQTSEDPQVPDPQASENPQASDDPASIDLSKVPLTRDEYRIPEFGLTEFESGDDSAENCTVECVPEAVLHEESDSNSETELHKEDIEDIIANYHIKQNKELADRLKPCDAEIPKESQAEKPKSDIGNVKSDMGNGKSDVGNGKSDVGNGKSDVGDGKSDVGNGKSDVGNGKSDVGYGKSDVGDGKENREVNKVTDKTIEDDDVTCIEIEVESIPARREPVFIEISVDAANRSGRSSPRDDCMMVLENVECNIDPAALMLSREGDDDRREEPISLLTSSDDDEVILQEPHIDTVEVSDETDEDDVPLVKLVSPKSESDKNLTKILWGSLYEYYCFQCNFKTTRRSDFKKHKAEHSTVIQMCEVCNYTSPSKTQFEKHKKKHKDEKRYKCHLCEYKAKHNMSLMYHLKSHEGVTIEAIRFKENLARKMKYAYKCSKCRFYTNVKREMLSHVKGCSTKMYGCDKCSYQTKRKSDLRRHKARRHVDISDDDEEYIP